MALGFDSIGFTTPTPTDGAPEDLREFLALGLQGDMDWLARTADRRADPRVLWPAVRSIVVLGLNYGPEQDPLALLEAPDRGSVSVYARNRDYHDILKKKLKALARWMHQSFDCEVKVFVDTAPVMEKPIAERAGLGWQGKHTNLVSRGFGSWLFLGEVFTTLVLTPDAPEADHCGRCRNCLDVCPTDAFPAPYRLDARRCISYLTIEHRGHIDQEFRAAMGNRIYGCDDCLAVCPWNKFAARTQEMAFLPRVELTAPRLADLAALDDASFRQVFAGSPIKRLGRDRFLRNVLIAIGNSGDGSLAPAVEGHLTDPSPLVRAMAVWALSRVLDAQAFKALRGRHSVRETDAAVRAEWQAGPSE
ncbi:MAG: tRNA epoxyqueuosine(34) reductase QueG [Alphaproteobacteria bacterium]|nr:tRNA epoxyqueuosine(34) reductase QueG [Alphaproteobacteria bacterium]